MLIPAVDVLGEEAVRLRRGDYGELVERGHDPLELVRRFAERGARWIHAVDLDGARTGVIRPALVRELAVAAAPVRLQASGGIRSIADAEALLDAGASRVVLGTAAWESPAALRGFAGALGERLVVALDVRDGAIATNGWTASCLPLAEALARCRDAGVARVLCTSIERDGTAAGPDVELVREVAAAGIPVLAAGGVRDARDVEALMAAGAEAVVAGRALLSGALAV